MSESTVTELVIPREKWGRVLLLDYEGKKCCLGHLGTACGISDKAMRGFCAPSDITVQNEVKYPEAFQTDHPSHAYLLAMTVNDHPTMPRREKEYRLKILFKAHGINLSFTGVGGEP